jgi:hypothetical protein
MMGAYHTVAAILHVLFCFVIIFGRDLLGNTPFFGSPVAHKSVSTYRVIRDKYLGGMPGAQNFCNYAGLQQRYVFTGSN